MRDQVTYTCKDVRPVDHVISLFEFLLGFCLAVIAKRPALVKAPLLL